MPSQLAYDFKAGKFTKCTILASRFIEWESEEERIHEKLVDMSQDLDERIDREIELEEQLEEAKAKYRAQPECDAGHGDTGGPRNQKIQNISWRQHKNIWPRLLSTSRALKPSFRKPGAAKLRCTPSYPAQS
jgi:hypothetical protein